MLQTLRDAAGGTALLAQIERGQRVGRELQSLIEQALHTFVRNAIDRYARTVDADRVTRLKLRLIGQRLAGLEKNPGGSPETIELSDTTALTQHLVAAFWAAGRAATPRQEQPKPPATASAHLEPLRQTLEKKLDEAILANLDSIASLGSIELTLKGIQAGELEEWRDILHDATREIIDDYRKLGTNLRQAQLYARELGRHMTTTPDVAPARVTPDRAELLQRLEAEMRRAQRHRQPLSLALLGPDRLEDIKLLVGPQATTEIMRRYQESIASCARAYDVITGCRPHKLLWLLPGADAAQGGIKALRKAQERLTNAHYHYGGRLRPLPTFSAGIVDFAPGENCAHFLARAERIAAQAKLAGPNHIELDRRRTAPAN